jgi:hypothetical protein
MSEKAAGGVRWEVQGCRVTVAGVERKSVDLTRTDDAWGERPVRYWVALDTSGRPTFTDERDETRVLTGEAWAAEVAERIGIDQANAVCRDLPRMLA